MSTLVRSCFTVASTLAFGYVVWFHVALPLWVELDRALALVPR